MKTLAFAQTAPLPSYLIAFAVGPYELDWHAEQYKCWISRAIVLVLLSFLQSLNLFWLFFIIRIAYRFAFAGVAKDDRSDGDDSDEEEEPAAASLKEKKDEAVPLLNGSNGAAAANGASKAKANGGESNNNKKKASR